MSAQINAKICITTLGLFSLAASAMMPEKEGPGFDSCNKPDRKHELVADPKSCQSFYACVYTGQDEIFAYQMHCDVGMGFNQVKQRCEPVKMIPLCGSR